MSPRPVWRVLLLALPLVVASATGGFAQELTAPPDPPLLVLLSDTGERYDDLPVLEVRNDAENTQRALSQGLPGTVLRVYRWVQVYRQAKDGIVIEPAYVLLSDRQGGFAREGFVLDDETKPETAYVDVHRDWPVTGEFGALDQIVPHEMAHAIRRQLVGPLADGGANQVHALALKTDRVTAFNEGFAEHLQPMAIDHPDADPLTRALAANGAAYERVRRHLAAYRQEIAARMAVAPRMRMGFLAWFSNGEDVLRYFAVKENAFAREPTLPQRLLAGGDPYEAYLLENILLGAPGGAAKSVARMLSSEGVVSALFYHWATHEGLRSTYREDDFYATFGARPAEVSPIENIYLKLFEVFYLAKPQGVLDVVEAYKARFPDEAGNVDEVLAEVLLGQPVESTPEIWLANSALETGTTLFDQYRGLPRVHSFDLNSASPVDLAGVVGVDPPLSQAIRSATPFRSLDDLRSVPGLDDRRFEQFQRMRQEMQALRAAAEEQSIEDVISIQAILMPYAWRALAVIGIATLLAALLYFRLRSIDGVRRPARAHAVLAGLGASLVALCASWALGSPLVALLAVTVLFGLPCGLWQLRRPGGGSRALNALVAWSAAGAPAVVLSTPWF